MPKDLGSIFNDVCIKAGLKSDDAALKNILTNPELTKIMIPDDAVTAIEGNLMNAEAAKSKLSATIKAEALNGVDDHIHRLMSDRLKLDSTELDEVKGEKSTGKKVELALNKAIARFEKQLDDAKKSGPGASPEKDALLQTINTLKAEKAAMTADHTKAIEAESAKNAATESKMALRFSLMEFLPKVDLPEGLDIQEKLDILENRVMKAASDKKLKLINNNSRTKITKDDGSDYYDDANKPVDFNAFAERTIAPILKKSDSGQPPAGGGILNVPGTVTPGDANFLSQMNKQAAHLGVSSVGQ